MLTLSDGDFNRLYTYIQQHYGINLSHKKQLITSRLTNMLQQKGFHSFTQYVDEIISGKDPEMVSVMLNKLTTNYTYFMREKEHFDFLQKHILPELANSILWIVLLLSGVRAAPLVKNLITFLCI